MTTDRKPALPKEVGVFFGSKKHAGVRRLDLSECQKKTDFKLLKGSDPGGMLEEEVLNSRSRRLDQHLTDL